MAVGSLKFVRSSAICTVVGEYALSHRQQTGEAAKPHEGDKSLYMYVGGEIRKTWSDGQMFLIRDPQLIFSSLIKVADSAVSRTTRIVRRQRWGQAGPAGSSTTSFVPSGGSN